MVVMIESCQNTLCNPEWHCHSMGLWNCRPVRGPILTPVYHWKLLQWSSDIGLWSSARRWPTLMNHFLFYILWKRCPMGRRQAGRGCVMHWVQAFMCMLAWHIPPPSWTLLQIKYTSSQKQYSLMGVNSFSVIMRPSRWYVKIVQEWFE